MKFWELVSIFSNDKKTLVSVLKRARWTQYSEWLSDYPTIVGRQDRTILDFPLPDELCREVLSLSPERYQLRDGQLTSVSSRSARSADVTMSAVEAFDRFGGSALEEVSEKGCSIVPER